MNCLVAFLSALVKAWLSHLFDPHLIYGLVSYSVRSEGQIPGRLWSRIPLRAQDGEELVFGVKAQQLLVLSVAQPLTNLLFQVGGRGVGKLPPPGVNHRK